MTSQENNGDQEKESMVNGKETLLHKGRSMKIGSAISIPGSKYPESEIDAID